MTSPTYSLNETTEIKRWNNGVIEKGYRVHEYDENHIRVATSVHWITAPTEPEATND